MIYFIYKGLKEKEQCQEYFFKINKILYKGNGKRLREFYSKVSFVDYSNFNDGELLGKIDNEKDCLYTTFGDFYYKLYDNVLKKEHETDISRLVSVYTHVIACTDEELKLIAITGQDLSSFDFFYGEMDQKISNKILNIPNVPSYNKELIELALIAFSNNKNIKKDNDLMNGYLFDRKKTKDKYEKAMGKGSVQRLNYFFNSLVFSSVDNSFPESIYLAFLSELRIYLHKSIKDNVSPRDESEIIINFEMLYRKLVEHYTNKNKKILQ